MSSTQQPRPWAFDLAATGLFAGALVHLAALWGGPQWMAALGAPPSIVSSAAAGRWPALLATMAIAALLAGLALCCLGAARGAASLLPFRGALGLFALIFLARGLLVVPFVLTGHRSWHTPVAGSSSPATGSRRDH